MWVEKNTVFPLSAMDFSIDSTLSWFAMSRAEQGSSRSTASESCTIAEQMDTICLSPPLSSPRFFL